ncbi:urease accessory protein UreD [Rugosimonospora africana]|uniref:Urease accessory protein UreD n=1 Tax=Rugosimonospora africana TaxID=556532 RepID=A0A8J3VQG0_9ACTN|nr:urease accessory protein UreD [Rugosimonospora africana]GIH15012.1 urease accessory protein UreD [Rugosimonospora africana]
MIELDDAPELAPYHDEPAQLPSAAPGKVGLLRLAFEHRAGRTVLADLYRQAPLLAQRALYWDPEMPELACVYVISTSGGILQGDRYRIDVSLGAGARALVTTQAATKIQAMDANYASQIQRLDLAENAYLECLPEPVVPYRHSRFITHTTVTLPESATLLYAETLLPGRTHHGGGEVFQYDLFSSTLRAGRPHGPDLFVDKFVVAPGRWPTDRLGVLGDFQVLGSAVLLTAPGCARRVFDRTPPSWDGDVPLAAGVSRLPNDAGLMYRVLGMETEPVRAKVREFCALARREAVGRGVPPVPAWR